VKEKKKYIEDVLKAKKILNDQNTKTLEEQFQEKLDLLRNINLGEEALKQDHVDGMTEKLDEDEKKELDYELKKVSNSYSTMLNKIADALEDPTTRAKILEELKTRVG